jgi:hypothetical protein
VVVVGIIPAKENGLREKMEQHIVGDLKSLGYNAVCSCNEIEWNAFNGLTEEEALALLKKHGVDAVFTVVMLDKTKERFPAPGRISYSPAFHNQFWSYYSYVQEKITEESYYATSTEYFWESHFYELFNNRLLYSAQSHSYDPVSLEALGHEYGQMIVNDMVKTRILDKQSRGF